MPPDTLSRHLYVRLWFGGVTIRDASKAVIPMDAFLTTTGRAHHWLISQT